MTARRAACLALFAALFTGCATQTGLTRANAVADAAGFVPRLHATHGFNIATWLRTADAPRRDGAPRTLRVYIEGDGRAWLTRNRISPDPTPGDPVGLELAARDPFGDDVLYLARPCQYGTVSAARCHPALWTSARYSAPVVAALDTIISDIAAELGSRQIAMVGYSGGGVVAALIAARRDDIQSLTTVAAPMDHAAWTRHHNVSPLSDSLNPVDFTDRLRGIRQTHFAGSKDDTVPPASVAAYLDTLGSTDRAQLRVIDGFDHGCCWVRDWPTLAARLP